VQEWPLNPPEDLNPHGISVRDDLQLMLTTDFVNPASTLGAAVQFRNTVRVWDFASKTIVSTVVIPNGRFQC
jgi:hypothetical protein